MNNKLEKIIDLLIEKTEEGKIKWEKARSKDGATAYASIQTSPNGASYDCYTYRCLTMEDKEYFISEEKFRIMENGEDYPLSPEIDDYMLAVHHFLDYDEEEDDFDIDGSIYINSQQYPTLKDKLIKLNDLASAEVDTPSDMCSDLINVLTSIK